MLLSVISPERFVPHEAATLHALFAAGLRRYHVRKPAASAPELAQWLRTIEPQWRERLILHSYHALVDTLGLGGRHARDRTAGDPAEPRTATGIAAQPLYSCACHDLDALERALPRHDIVLLSPVFASNSKPGYGPSARLNLQRQEHAQRLRDLLDRRGSRGAAVFALGGITPERVAACRALGFDGVAVLGALWEAPDPLDAFHHLQTACLSAAPTPAPLPAGG